MNNKPFPIRAGYGHRKLIQNRVVLEDFDECTRTIWTLPNEVFLTNCCNIFINICRGLSTENFAVALRLAYALQTSASIFTNFCMLSDKSIYE